MTLYETLGVAKDATADELKAAYRRESMKHHPDRGGDEAAFKAMKEAYEVLSDVARRQRYDETGATSDKPTPEEAALDAIGELLLDVLEQKDADSTDLLAVMRKAIDNGYSDAQSKKAQLGKKIKNRKSALKRLRRKDDRPNLLSAVLERDIAKLDGQLQEQDAIADLIGIMQKSLDGYAYDYERGTPPGRNDAQASQLQALLASMTMFSK